MRADSVTDHHDPGNNGRSQEAWYSGQRGIWQAVRTEAGRDGSWSGRGEKAPVDGGGLIG